MAVTRIKNNQITDLTVNAASKLQDYSVTSAKIANNLTYNSSLTVAGNLTVQGNVTAIDTHDLVVEDPLILLAKDQIGTPILDIGYIGVRGDELNIAMVWDESAKQFVTAFTADELTNTTITINSYASLQTGNLTAGNVSFSGILDVTGNVTIANIQIDPSSVIDAGNNKVSNVAEPSANSDAATKGYVDSVSGAGFTIEDDTANTTVISGGDTLELFGTANEVTVAITANDQVTFGLPANVTISDSLSVTNSIGTTTVTASGNITGNNLISNNDVTTATVTATGNVAGGNLTTVGQVVATGNVTGGNVTTVGQVTATGNVSGGNVTTVGQVAATGNVSGGNVTTVGQVAATGNVAGGNLISSNDVTTVTVTATGNVAGGNITTAGQVTATGNVSGGNLTTAGQVTATGNVSGGNVVTTGQVTATGNVAGGNVITAGQVVATGNVSGGNVATAGQVTATGNVTGGNVNTAGNVTASYVIATDGIIGNVEITDLTVGNINATGYANIAGNVIVGNLTSNNAIDTVSLDASANITGNNLISNNDVTTATVTATGNVAGGNITTAGQVTATGNVTGGNLTTAGQVTATGNIAGGNVTTAGQVTATGNITGNNLVSSNDVTTVTVTASGNVSGGNITTAGQVTATGNVAGGNVTTAGQIVATGNVSGGNVITAGQVTATGNVAGGNITTTGQVVATGNVTGGNVNTAGQIVATGNVSGGNVITAGQVTATGNVAGGNLISAADVTTVSVTASGNVSANNISVGNLITASEANISGNVDANNINTDFITATDLTITAGNISMGLTGNIDMNGRWINDLADPVQAFDAATKQYVDDAVSSGIHVHTPVDVETTTALTTVVYAQGGNVFTVNETIAGNTVVFSTAANLQVNDQLWFDNSFNGVVGNLAYFVVSTPNTSSAVLTTVYNGVPVSNITSGSGLTESVRVNSGVGATLTATANGAIVVDGVSLSAGNRVLVDDQLNQIENGVYTVTDAGNLSAPYILTRSSDADLYIPDSSVGLDQGSYFYVLSGVSSAGSSYVKTQPAGPYIIGYGNIVFTQFSASSSYSANTQAGLVLNGTIFSAKVDNNTTAFDIGGNIKVKDSANLVTPNIGDATGNSLTLSGNGLLSATTVTASGNITGGNLNSNAVVTSVTVLASGNITGNNLISNNDVTTATVTATGNVAGGNITTVGQVTATGNVAGGNITTAGQVVATGNVAGGNITTVGQVTATGNVAGGNITTVGQVTATGNVAGGNLTTVGQVTATGNVTGGNINTVGQVVATGNVSGLTFLGNVEGSYATFTGNVTAANFIGNIQGNIDAGGANTEIQFNDNDILAGSPGFTFDKTSNLVTVSGNVSAANLTTSGVVSATGNISGGNITTAGRVTATGNITGGNLISLADVTTVTVTASGNVAANNLISSNDVTTVTVTASGNISGNNVVSSNSITATGNISGNNLVSSNDVTTVTVTASGNVSGGNITTAGQVVATGNVAGGNLTTVGQVTATGNVAGGNVTTAGQVVATGNVAGGNLTTVGQVTATGNVSGGNVTTAGQVVATGNVAGGNITTVGAVSAASAAITGNASATTFLGNIEGTYGNFTGTVTANSFVGNIDAGGSNTQVQFNDGDILNGSAGFTFDKTANLVTVTGNIAGGNLTTVGRVDATGNVAGGNITTAGRVDATGNIAGGNITTVGRVDATGNVSGGNITTAANITGGNISVTGVSDLGNIRIAGNDITNSASNEITINSAGSDINLRVSGDNDANLFIVDAGSDSVLIGTATPTTNVALKIGTTNSMLLPVGNTVQRPATGVAGMLRFNTTEDTIEYYDSDSWNTVTGDFTVIVADDFNGDGSTVNFTLSQDSTTAATIVSINGVVQIPVTAYSVTGNVLTFTEAPEATDVIDARILTTTTTVTELVDAGVSIVLEPSAGDILITGNLIPTANVTYDLGNSTNFWNNLYLAGNTIYLGNLQLKEVNSTTFGIFTADGNTQADIDVGNIDVSAISSGTTTIGIAGTSGNAYVTVAATANVLVVNTTGITVTGDATVTGNVTAQDVNSLSDATLKTNINPLTGVDAVISQLRGVEYDWRNGSGHSYGFLAQEVEQILPAAVKTGADGLKSINYMMIIPFLVETIKQLGAEVADLKKRLD